MSPPDDTEAPRPPRMRLPFQPPIAPMEAKAVAALPGGTGDWQYEPKWDGFRAIAFKEEGNVYLSSRQQLPFSRYFPEVGAAVATLPAERLVLDGEIVVFTPDGRGLDFDVLQLRLHPAASRVAKLAAETPASFVAFDLLAEGDADLRARPQSDRRARLERALAGARAPVHLTPCTRERPLADEWFHRFEGAGLDGVIAKHESSIYAPGKRVMVKVKHVRAADCVVAGFRWHKQGPGELVGSLLLGLYDSQGALHHVGVTASFTMAAGRRLAQELGPLRKNALVSHPWREWAGALEGGTRMPGASSRWSQGKDLSWEPLRIERVCEVKYDHLQRARFRHAAAFMRWRSDQ